MPKRFLAGNRGSNRYRPYKVRQTAGKVGERWPAKTQSYRSRNALARQPRVGFATRQLVKMRYFADVELDPGAGAMAAHIFSANGLFDPDITGVGHQPYSFDQWMAVYDHYHVVGAKISVTFLSTQEAAANNHVGVSL